MAIRNSNGSALMSVIIAGGIIASISLILPRFYTDNEKTFKVNYVRNSITILKESLISLLDNDAAWAEIVSRNQSMACLVNAGAVCTAGPHSGIDIYEGDGTLFLANSPTAGLTLNGAPCNKFDPVKGHPECVLKFIVSWECNGACVPTQFSGVLIANKPNIKLTATLKYSPDLKNLRKLIDTNANQYTFNFIRGSQTKTLSKFCNSLSGVFNQQDQLCAAATAEPGTFDCTTILGPHAYFIGFFPDGSPKCLNDANLGVACKSGTAILGYGPDGRNLCGAF